MEQALPECAEPRPPDVAVPHAATLNARSLSSTPNANPDGQDAPDPRCRAHQVTHERSIYFLCVSACLWFLVYGFLACWELSAGVAFFSVVLPDAAWRALSTAGWPVLLVSGVTVAPV